MSTSLPETLVKFCSAGTAKTILRSQTLRWSAPHLFSDPFELNYQSQLNFDPHILLQAAIKMTSAMIFGRDDPVGATPLIAAIRRWRDEERFSSPEEAEIVLKELLAQVVDQRQLQLDKVMADWRKFTRNLRICCFSAKPDNLMAWQNFGDQHRGIAIRFQCGEFTGFQRPVKVNYAVNRPEITTLKEQMSCILYNDRVVPQENFYEKFAAKSTTCSGEQEWRCFFEESDNTAAATTEPTWYKDVRFEQSEVKAVYFGAFTPTDVKREVLDLIKSRYSQARIFQAKTVSGRYEIEFERITAR